MSTILAPAPGAYVQHGSLRVPVQGEAAFETAEKYLRRDPVMDAIFNRAEHGTRELTLSINSRNNDSFDPNTGTVHWDPYSALRTTLGGTQTPALGLGHELDHATVDPALGARLSAKFDASYDNAEERRVITGSETHAAKTLGEGLRTDHDGTTYHVHSPTER